MDISLSGSAPAPEEDEGGGLEAAYIDAPPPPAASERRTLSGERWVPDTEAVECEACSGKFGFWRRRVRAQATTAPHVPTWPHSAAPRRGLL